MDDFSRILIVDDERQNIKVLKDFLRDDYKIMAAKTGEQALEAARSEHPPDLILLDIVMPEMDGYDLCRILKEDEKTMHIPIIFVTGLGSTNDEAKGFELGAVDYITKPFRPVIVKARIKTHIQLKRKSDLLDRLASIDGLTEIPNRRSFNAVLEREIRRAYRSGSSISLILLDIDLFKKYNDYYGHAAGDTCLRRVAKSIDRILNRASDIAARYGGEEFGVILPDTDLEGALHVAETIREAVASLNIEHAASSVADMVSVSLGAASLQPDVKTAPLDLINAADAALYQAKDSGRNKVCGGGKQLSKDCGDTGRQWTQKG
ncbi:diguanylate cyclase [Desulfatibacillum aliphaticivorans]|uniref:diguanylate cyclase n=1 Tax=Desulfatibacillum aliphaticivorans TaxID=218208 RepID=UPI0004014E30|nr:diguanylate cyclase [Desulfatibacillum aliphaticivorans]